MGASQSDVLDGEFIKESVRDNFVLSITQCRLDEPMQFNREVINKRKNTQNFVIITKGERQPARIWHSTKILVAAMVLEDPPLDQFYCSFYQYHSQTFLAIHVDVATYYHICFFMNKCRFFAQREEFLTRVATCIEDYDDILARYITTENTPPIVKMPTFQLANPYPDADSLARDVDPFEFDSQSGQLFNILDTNKKPDFLSQRSTTSSSVMAPVSEPDSLRESQTQPFSETSSSFGYVSEPSTNQINYAESNTSSAFDPVSEPQSSSDLSGLSPYTTNSSTFGIISESGTSRGSMSSNTRRRKTNHRNINQLLDEKLTSGNDSVSDNSLRKSEMNRGRNRGISNEESDHIATLDNSLHSESSSNSRSSRRSQRSRHDSESGSGRRNVPDVRSLHSMSGRDDSNNSESYSSRNISDNEYSSQGVHSVKSLQSGSSSGRRRHSRRNPDDTYSSASYN